MDEGVGPGRWQDDLYDLLRRNNVTQFAYVPDAGHRILIDRSLADPEVCGSSGLRRLCRPSAPP
jgi:hypothetical protein